MYRNAVELCMIVSYDLSIDQEIEKTRALFSIMS